MQDTRTALRNHARKRFLQAAGLALELADRAETRAIDAMRRGELAACRAELERRLHWQQRASAHLAEYKKLETNP